MDRCYPRGVRTRTFVAATVIATLGLAASAPAATRTFEYTGAAQTWTVPSWVTGAAFDLYGAQGGGDDRVIPPVDHFPGLGGRATATVALPPGDSIQVNVGGQGLWLAAGNSGGFNGGGNSLGIGGGGGGASDIRIGGTGLNNRVLVAGGGGGAASQSCNDTPSVAGGGGGGDHGEPGAPSTPSCADIDHPGGGGTQTAGGAAGGRNATAGGFGFGGQGDDFAGVGGGGGGGWYGGGAGYFGMGGGGGSGHGPAGTVFETGVRHGNGVVVVTFAGPMIGKQRTRDALAAKQAFAAKNDAKEIGNAIQYLNKSLEPSLWVDDAHLDPKQGLKVFDEERHAAETLLRVAAPSVAAEIARLVEIDRMLATSAIDQAVAMPVSSKRQKEIDEANKELANGDASRTGDPKKAIDSYRKAWQRAQSAIVAK